MGRTDKHRPRMGFEQYGDTWTWATTSMRTGMRMSMQYHAFQCQPTGQHVSPLYDADQWITRGMVSAAVENHYNQTSGAVSLYTNFGRIRLMTVRLTREPTKRYFRSKDALLGISLSECTNSSRATG